MGELIGISGAIGSGKTTFANFLASCEPQHAIYETYTLVAEIANAFNQALRAELVFETAQTDIDLVNQVLIWLPEAISEHLHCHVVWNQLAITSHDTRAHPALYEKLFLYLRQVKQKPELLGQPITSHNKADYRALLQWIGGYLVVKIQKTIWYDELLRRIFLRESHTKLVIICGIRYPSDAEAVRHAGGKIITIVRPNMTTDNRDVTESQRSAIKPDTLIINKADESELQLVAEAFVNDLFSGTLKAQYAA